MNVILAEPVQVALRFLGDDDRRRVGAWIDNLKNWKTDPFLRTHSHKLDASENVYMLRTSNEYRIFFSLEPEKETITVLDVAKKATIVSSGHVSGNEEP